MKKTVIILLGLILVTTIFVYADNHNRKDYTIEVSRFAQGQLQKMNLTNLNHSGLVCEEDYCEFSLWSETKVFRNDIEDIEYYRLGTHKIDRRYCVSYNEDRSCALYNDYTDLELWANQVKFMEEYLEEYAKTSAQREQNKLDNRRDDGGRVTVNERKR